ncbi:hypothetical protein [Duganella vulcania]|uniref:Uncharacterized protein n=1 Tax=Duganella vulcania TaxID=2692166 RepID=A0A845GIS8_9BURK|nr:hypothetical protein [Duganella vulcania]MYM92569.1 hypothetical protein [Duganella vulcania]
MTKDRETLTPAEKLFDVLVEGGLCNTSLTGSTALLLHTHPKHPGEKDATVEVLFVSGERTGRRWQLGSRHIVPHVPGRSAAWRDGRITAFRCPGWRPEWSPHEEGSLADLDWWSGFKYHRDIEQSLIATQ